MELQQADFERLGVPYLPEKDYQKALGQLRMQTTGIFDFLRADNKLPVRYVHGLGVFVPGATEEIVKLAEDFGLRVRGIDKAIALDLIRRKSGRYII